MSGVSEFVAAALRADPTLAGTSDEEKAAITSVGSEAESLSKNLSALNERLTPLTYLHSNTPSTADVSLYCHLHPSLINAPATQHPSLPSVTRYFMQIQSLYPVQSAHSALPNSFPPPTIDVSSLPPPPRQAVVPVKKDKKDKKAVSQAEGEGVVASVTAAVEGAAQAVTATAKSAGETIAATGGVPGAVQAEEGGKKKEKKEKKEKPAKAQPVKEEPVGPMPSMIDMRVGKVLNVKKHPDAESLYVEQIDIGEPEPRTVCSGLVKYMKEEDIMGQHVIVICNLKPVAMRGVKSYAMLLCASSKEGKEEGGVEFVLPPDGSQAGDRIYFEGQKYESAQPEVQLNPKKKVFETIQPDFVTLDNRDAAWVDPESKSVHRIRSSKGICKAKSFIGASLS